jgi:colanic acid/amylovoran biosynthesis glycosyltransferase
MALVARDHADVVHTVIGDGDLRHQLEALVLSLGLTDRVRFLGERTHDEVREHIGRSSLLVAPSVTAVDGDEEGIPNTLKEAMAARVPVVATRHAGIPELVEDGVSGHLVPERDVDALAARIGALVADPERRAAMGRAGERAVRRNYDRDVLNRELVALYTRLLDGTGERPERSTPRARGTVDADSRR